MLALVDVRVWAVPRDGPPGAAIKEPRVRKRAQENQRLSSKHHPSSPPDVFAVEAARMKGVQFLAGLLLLVFVQGCVCVPLQDDGTSTETAESVLSRGPAFTTMKRHSEGTFSNDYSKYLETRRAQDFVQWLMNSKRNGGSSKRHAEGTYTSDVSSYLQDQAAQNFVAWLKSGQPKQDVGANRVAMMAQRRHVDGSFTSDVNKVLDSIAAKEYLQWVMSSKTSGTSAKRGGNQ